MGYSGFLGYESEIGPENLGELEYHEKTRTALIRILDRSEWSNRLGTQEIRRECENTVLHELVHLMLSGVTPAHDTDEEERVVVDLTAALFAAEKYGK